MIKAYIKKCKLCGLQYVGQTEQELNESTIKYPNEKYYEGSGVYWRKHNIIPGHEFHNTKILFESNDREEIKEYFSLFTKANPFYWESTEFANLIEEDGQESSFGKLSSHPRWRGGKSYFKLSKDILNKKRKIDSLINESEKRFANHQDDWTIDCRLAWDYNMPIDILKSVLDIWPKTDSAAADRQLQDYKSLKRPWGLRNFKLLEYNILHELDEGLYNIRALRWPAVEPGNYYMIADRTWDLEMDLYDLQDLEI